MFEKLNSIIKKMPLILILFVVVVSLLFVLFKLVVYLMPFVIAIIVSTLIEPVIRVMMRKFRLSRKLSAALSIFFILILFAVLLILFTIRVINEIRSLYFMFPKLFSDFYGNFRSFMDKVSEIYLGLPAEFTNSMDAIISNISISIMNIMNGIFQGILNTAVSLPDILVFIIVTVLSTYFITSDRVKIYRFFKRQLPPGVLAGMISVKNSIFTALVGYLKAQVILMAVTFTVLSISFLAGGIKYALLTALFICLVDALPILGTGSVLVPWAVYDFLTGRMRFGLYILAIYGMVMLVRQIIEPKVLGRQTGIHPLLALLAMYGGLKLFGVFGMFLGPILLLIMKSVLTGTLKNRTVKDVLTKKIS